MDAPLLTNEQQFEAMAQRLGAEDAAKLVAYVRSRFPTDPVVGSRITALSPVLSVVMSIFERRKGQVMPPTASEVYKEIVEELTEPGQLPLLRAVFFCMHVVMLRIGESAQVETAAQMIGMSEAEAAAAIASFKEGRMPLIKVIRAEPLTFKHARVEIQAFSAACAICEGMSFAGGPPPWKWPEWWASTLSFGAEMGPTFGRGLLKSAGVELDGALDLSGELGGHLPTVIRALCLMMAGLKTLNLQSNSLPEDSQAMLKQAADGRVELQL
jgi:hypothetical protein